MAISIQRANERGHKNHGWLDANHSFSFGGYHNPEKMGFGTLVVLNQDTIEGGYGFPTHSHDNMEIITIPLMGKLAHKDSTGDEETITYGDVQVMSAGRGIQHSEYNASLEEIAHLLQIWIVPHTLNIRQRHESKSFDFNESHNKWLLLVSDDSRENSLMINQHAFASITTLDAGTTITYENHIAGNGIYVFIIRGSVDVSGQTLAKSDAMEITALDNVIITAQENAQVLILEVPMQQ